MPHSNLPERASLEYLRKLAKERLREQRISNPAARLSAAQLDIAREHGFPSWRALKAEVDRRRSSATLALLTACRAGDVATLRGLLEREPTLVGERNAEGTTPLHAAVAHPACVRMLLEGGADPNRRDRADHAYALHFAAAGGHLETVRLLLDAGGDVQGTGDRHESGVIGWAVGDGRKMHRDVVALLIERGARHHIFSALGMGDVELVRTVVAADPDALFRRRSRFEQGQSPLHFVLAAPDGREAIAPQHEMAELLIELGADVEAEDDKGRTPLVVAMLHGDLEAMRLLHAAGAKPPQAFAPANLKAGLSELADSIKKGVPSIAVPDVAATLDWYVSIGFKEIARYEDDGLVNFGMVSFGKAELMLVPGGKAGPHDVSLWFYTDKIESLYQLFKARQLEATQAALAGRPGDRKGIVFVEDLYEPFYGGRQFSVRDLNEFVLIFLSP